jgi:VWFA-related protein
MTNRLIVGLLAVLTAAPAAAQQPEFKAGVELVTVPVTVTSNDHNTYIEGLTAADFRVTENGQRQTVTTVTRERRPISVCFVIDSSGSMALGNRRDLASMAVDRIVGQLTPDDEVAMVLFEEKVEERLPWTKVGPGVKLNWGGWAPRGSTALNDGMRLGFRLIESARNDRRVIVLVTDGFENASRESTANLVKTRQQSETTIVGIGVGSPNIADLQADVRHVQTHMPPANAENLRKFEASAPGASGSVRPPDTLPHFDYLETLVGDSGGSVRRLLSQPEVAMAAKNIVDELQYEYVIGYTPTRPLDGKYRKVKVEVARRGTFVRHRGGYLAIPSKPQ